MAQSIRNVYVESIQPLVVFIRPPPMPRLLATRKGQCVVCRTTPTHPRRPEDKLGKIVSQSSKYEATFENYLYLVRAFIRDFNLTNAERRERHGARCGAAGARHGAERTCVPAVGPDRMGAVRAAGLARIRHMTIGPLHANREKYANKFG